MSIGVAFTVGWMAGRLRDMDTETTEIPYRVKEHEIEDIYLN